MWPAPLQASVTHALYSLLSEYLLKKGGDLNLAKVSDHCVANSD